MQKAIVMPQLARYAVILVPGFSDLILGRRGLADDLGGWPPAMVGPIGCVPPGEIRQLITKMQKQRYQQQLVWLQLGRS